MAGRRALLLLLSGLAAVRSEDHWAVLIAGSKGYYNYRHQADVCHAYHLLVQRGFHPDRIITMMYDDVAKSDMNPFPGKLYNFPWKSEAEAVDVYAGCKLDYVGKHVTPEKFLAVLSGDEEAAGGKVLKSKADDHVFVNFVDHGGVGIIAFPEDEVLHAAALNRTLTKMHERRMYKQLIFYLETCESGSMFEGVLSPNIDAYALTAANAKESSWGTFCGQDSKVMGKNLRSCLGDLFSVSWMMDSEASAGAGKPETLLQQFLNVKNHTAKSHVMRYGSYASFEQEDVSDFQGPGGALAELRAAERLWAGAATSVDARDAKLHQLYQDYADFGTDEASEALIAEIRRRQEVKSLGLRIATLALGSAAQAGDMLAAPAPEEFAWTYPECHERAAEAFGSACGWSEQRLTLSKVLFQLCERAGGDQAQVVAALREACGPAPPPASAPPRTEVMI